MEYQQEEQNICEYYYPSNVPLCAPQGPCGPPGPCGEGLYMDSASFRGVVTLASTDDTPMKVPITDICECAFWSLYEPTVVGLLGCGNYQWTITLRSMVNGDTSGHVLSTQVVNLIQTNQCSCEIPVIGTVQPFIQDGTMVYTTSGFITNLDTPRYAINVKLNRIPTAPTVIVNLEARVSILRIRGQYEVDEFRRC